MAFRECRRVGEDQQAGRKYGKIAMRISEGSEIRRGRKSEFRRILSVLNRDWKGEDEVGRVDFE